MANISGFSGLQYSPEGADKSSIDYGTNSDQMNTFYWLRKSLTEARKEAYFTQLADSIDMPKHYGKRIKLYQYIPLLDDRNINDQGIDANGVTFEEDGSVTGNLYGSSRDIGTIKGKLPVVGENGGRVNRVGFSRVELEGTFHKFGVFYEWSAESMAFDSDSELKGHLSRELMNGMVQMQEAMLQIDLLEAAGVKLYAGKAMKKDEITAEGAEDERSVLSYDLLRHADQILDENRCPRNTKYISGSRNVDTKTISAARIAYVSSALVPLLEDMKNKFNERVFVPVHQYASAANVLRGEVGSIGHFRFIQVPEMLAWEGEGAAVGSNPGFRETNGKYDVYPVLIVGSESFNTIGFQMDNMKNGKFSIITKVPGSATADRHDPYGETGFSSLKFFYGFLCKRPERICVLHTVAPE